MLKKPHKYYIQEAEFAAMCGYEQFKDVIMELLREVSLLQATVSLLREGKEEYHN